MAVSNLLKAVLHWVGNGEEGTLSWYYEGNDAGHTNAQLDSAAAAAVTALTSEETPSSKTGILARLSTTQSVDELTVYEYAVDNGPATAIGRAPLTGWTGTAATGQLPLQVCQVVSLRTAGSGRSFRGRQYWPAQNAGMTTTSLFSTASTDSLVTLAAAAAGDISDGIATTLSIGTLSWGVYSRKLRSIADVVQIAADNRPDIQRRRAFSQVATHTAQTSV